MELTNVRSIMYNRRRPQKCPCGKVVATIEDGKIFVKCRNCKQWIAVFDINKVQATREEPLRDILRP